jgi:hypothetical protein
VAELYIGEEKDGTHLYVDDIRGIGGTKPNDIGPAAMRDILRQVHAEFPNAKTYGGARVSGARDRAGTVDTKADVKFRFDLGDPSGIAEILQPTRGYKYTGIDGVEAILIPREELRFKERELVDKMNALGAKLTGGKVRFEPAESITHFGRGSEGMYSSFNNIEPLIMYSLHAEDLPNTVRHEALHHLRVYNYITKDEWAQLVQAAKDGDWIGKHKIRENYKNIPEDVIIEEAIAHEFGKWGSEIGKHTEQAAKYEGKIGAIFDRIRTMLEGIKEAVIETFGHQPTVTELFEKIESGEIGKRGPGEPMFKGDFDLRQHVTPEGKGIPFPEIPTTPETPAFPPKPGWITAAQFKRWMKKYEIQQAEEKAYLEGKVLAAEKKRQTKEWKDNYAATRSEVAADFRQRPDFQVDEFLHAGKHKLNADDLTAEQKAALPKSLVSKTGVDPRDIADFFGYDSADSLVNKVIDIEQARKASGMYPKAYFDRLIDAETDRQMQAKYGDLDANILAEAKEHVFSDSMIDLIAEDFIALGEKNFGKITMSIEDIKGWIKNEFAKLPWRSVNSDKNIADSGRARTRLEDHLDKDDYREALQDRQTQFTAAANAKEAIKFEKEIVQLDRLVKRFRPRDQTGRMDQQYANFAHDLLQKAGVTDRHPPEDIAARIAKDGNTTLRDFADYHNKAGGTELDIPLSVLDGNLKQIKDMTVQEFREFHDALKTLEHNGREQKQITVNGKKIRYDTWREAVLANIRSLPARAVEKQRALLFSIDAKLTRMEEIIKDLDLRQQLGPLYRALIEPMMQAKHTEYTMQEALKAKLNTMAKSAEHGAAWQKTLRDSIDQDFFFDPSPSHVDAPKLFDLTRADLISIAMHYGNKSNWEKFTKGYFPGKNEHPVMSAKLEQLLHDKMTKADWNYVREIGNLFEGWRKEADTVYHNLSGLSPKWIDLQPVTTPHGTFPGWYIPVIADKLRSQEVTLAKERASSSELFGPDYVKSTTGNGYTVERTGAAFPIEFQNAMPQLAGRMQQIIHDIAYRQAVMQANKIISDPKIRQAIVDHYGIEYAEQLKPWVRDIANHFNRQDEVLGIVSDFMRRVRFNLIGSAIPLNLRVLLSPALGRTTPAQWAKVWPEWKKYEDLAMHGGADGRPLSMELPHTYKNIDRDFREAMEAMVKKKGYDAATADLTRRAFSSLVWIDQRFRMVTWGIEFDKAIAKGWNKADAAEIADSAVRERHSTTGIPDLPAIMRGDEFVKPLTSFYGYFNLNYNQQRQFPGAARRGDSAEMLGIIYSTILLQGFFNATVYNRWKDDESIFTYLARSLAGGPMASIPFLREGFGTMVEGHPPSTPVGSMIRSIDSVVRDIYRASMGKPVKKGIQHAIAAAGTVGGIPGSFQAGRMAQFVYDVNVANAQAPKNIYEWIRGFIAGDVKK